MPEMRNGRMFSKVWSQIRTRRQMPQQGLVRISFSPEENQIYACLHYPKDYGHKVKSLLETVKSQWSRLISKLTNISRSNDNQTYWTSWSWKSSFNPQASVRRSETKKTRLDLAIYNNQNKRNGRRNQQLWRLKTLGTYVSNTEIDNYTSMYSHQ